MRVVFLLLSAICAAPFVVAALFAFVPPFRALFARLFASRLARGIENGTVHVYGAGRPTHRTPGRPPPGVIDTTGEEIPSVPPSRLPDGES